MEDGFKIEYKKDYLHVKQYGADSYDISLEMWKQIIKACAQYECLNILGESYTTDNLSEMDAYNFIEIFSIAGVTTKHRIAWVHHVEETMEGIEFTEIVLKNRGLVNGCLFSDINKAREWLSGSGPLSDISL